MEIRPLRRDQIELIWTIDRSERIERIYELRAGALQLRAAPFDVPGPAAPHERAHAYLGLGCGVMSQPDPELFAAEPEDIHLECAAEG